MSSRTVSFHPTTKNVVENVANHEVVNIRRNRRKSRYRKISTYAYEPDEKLGVGEVIALFSKPCVEKNSKGRVKIYGVSGPGPSTGG